MIIEYISIIIVITIKYTYSSYIIWEVSNVQRAIRRTDIIH